MLETQDAAGLLERLGYQASVDQSPYVAGLPEDRQLGLTSIIIPVYNDRRTIALCVESILRHSPHNRYELVLVDNRYSAWTSWYVARLSRRYAHIRRMGPHANLGFGRANNMGAAVASGDVLVFLNSDTIVTPGWLEHLVRPLRYSRTGFVGCLTNRAAGIQQTAFGGGQPGRARDFSSALDGFARRQQQEHAGRVLPNPWVIGFCMAVRREVFATTGGFDPQYGIGNSEDVDICIAATVSGYVNAIARDVFIYHFCNQGFRCLARTEGDSDGVRQATLLADNRARMARKWPPGVIQALSACIRGQDGKRIDEVDLRDSLVCMLQMRTAMAAT